MATTAFGVALVIGLVAAVPVLEAAQPDPPRSAIPFREPGGACQEHSGGDTHRPGG